MSYLAYWFSLKWQKLNFLSEILFQVLQDMGLPTGLDQKVAELVKLEEPVATQETLPAVTQMEPEPAPTSDSPTDEVPKMFLYNMYPYSGIWR